MIKVSWNPFEKCFLFQKVNVMVQFVVNPNPKYIDREADRYIILNENIIREDNKELLIGHYSILDIDETDAEKYQKDKEYINCLTDRVIQTYSERINKVFDISLSDEQIRYYVGIWLLNFLFDAYTRYKIVSSIKDSDVYTTVGTADPVKISQREYGFTNGFDQNYQMVLYAEIFEAIGFTVKKLDDSVSVAHNSHTKRIDKWRERVEVLQKNPSYLWTRLCRAFKDDALKDADILVVESRMPHSMENEITKRCGNSITFDNGWYFYSLMNPILQKHIVNKELRSALFDLEWGNNEFENIVFDLIGSLIPISFCEALPDIYIKAKNIVKVWNYKRIYHSAHITEMFAMCCALMKDKNASIIDIQHGAPYGISEYMRYNECRIWDGFIAWGNVFGGNTDKVQVVAMSRIPLHNSSCNNIIHNKILWTVGIPEKCDSGYGWNWSNYTKEQKQFIENLTDKERERLCIRYRVSDVSMTGGLVEWCEANYPMIRFECLEDISFVDSLLESDFLICDYFSSSHLEALMVGKPFIMFEGAKIVEYTESAKKYINEFNKFGVFQKTGKELAEQFVIHEDTDKWLYNDELQKLYNDYLYTMTNTQKNLIDEWTKEFS